MSSKFADMFTDLTAKEPLKPMVGGSLESVLSEIPVSLEVFIRDKKFLNMKEFIPSPIQADAVKHIERVYFPDMYSKLAEYDKYWADDFTLTNYHVLQWAKGCADPDTPVYDARTGQWPKLRDLRATLVAAANKKDGTVISSAAADSFLEGHGSMYWVTTKKGCKIKVWEGHKFLVPSGKSTAWKKLKNLKPGDHIALATTLPEPEECVEIDDREIEIMALWLSNGNFPESELGRNPTVNIHEHAVLLRQRYEDICSSYPNVALRQRKKSTDTQVVSFHVTAGRRADSPLRQMLWKYDLWGQRTGFRRLPKEFFSLSTEKTTLLVSRLIESGGWITAVPNTCEIGYKTFSQGLAEDVRNLWLRLGVVPEIVERRVVYKGVHCTSYQLRVRDNGNVKSLALQISLLDKEPARLAVMERLAGSSSMYRMHGDLYWDTVKSIDYDGEGEFWTTTVDGPSCYVSSGGLLNHNSGKDSVCRLSLLRISYLLLCLKSPQAYYGMPEDDYIHMLNVAKSARQAQTAFFDPLKKNIMRGWFADKAESTNSEIKFAKNVMGISGHSDAESQEGLNLILGICDEIDGFKTKEQLANGRSNLSRDSTKSSDHIINMMRSSGITRFPEVFKQAYISYPYYVGSKIMQLTEQGRKHNEEEGLKSNWYVSGPYATWEVKPSAKKEHFDSEYKADPAEAAAKYECKPSFAVDAYFNNHLAVEACMTTANSHCVAVSYITDGKAWVPKYEFSDDFYPIQGAQYAMHADLAIKNDRAGIAMAHVVRRDAVERKTINERGDVVDVTDMLPFVKVDFVIALEADLAATPSREIQVRWARDLWAELRVRGFNIRQFSFDNFQSQDSRQILESMGVAAPLISTDRSEEPWKGLKDLMYSNRVDIPYNVLLKNELLALTKRPNGKVDHTSFGSKDLADALACSCVGAIMVGGQEEITGARAYFAEPEFKIGSFGAIAELRSLENDPGNFEHGGYGFDDVIDVSTWLDDFSSGGMW